MAKEMVKETKEQGQKEGSSILPFEVTRVVKSSTKKWVVPYSKVSHGYKAMLPNCTKRVMLLRGRNKKWLLNHTEEELREYKELDIFKIDPVTKESVYNDEFLSKYIITIGDSGRVFDLSKEIDRFEYKVIQLPQYGIIGGINSDTQSLDARFYIKDPIEESKHIASRAVKYFNALNKLNKMTKSDLISFSSLYKVNVVTMTPELAESTIIRELERDEKNLDAFLDLFEEGGSNSLNVKPDTQDRIFLNLAIAYRVITVKGGYYYFRAINLGMSEKDVLRFINRPDNQQIKYEIEVELQDKLKGV